MDPTEPAAPSKPISLGRAFRRHWVICTVVGIVVAAAVVIVAELSRSDRPEYHAEALVVANELEIRVDSLPKTAVAIFETSATAELIASLAGTGIDPGALIPDIVVAEPVETTGVVEIDATHPDPELAAIYANAGAEALTTELNRVGPGLGTFSLQTPARVPEAPIPTSRRQLAIAAVIAGIAGALATATMYSAATRNR